MTTIMTNAEKKWAWHKMAMAAYDAHPAWERTNRDPEPGDPTDGGGPPFRFKGDASQYLTWDAMIEWFKTTQPAQAREAERKIMAMIEKYRESGRPFPSPPSDFSAEEIKMLMAKWANQYAVTIDGVLGDGLAGEIGQAALRDLKTEGDVH